MRLLHVPKKLFDRVLWTGVCRATSKDLDELEVVVRLIRKLKEHSTEVPDPEGSAKTDRTLDIESLPLQLEEDEHKCLLRRIEASAPIFLGYVAEDVYELLQIIRKAELQH